MRRSHKIRLSAGFTLIEVLITMLILAVGVLGIAALQFRGLQYSHDAYLRTQVNNLAFDMAERMRLNRENAADYVAEVDDYEVPAVRPADCVVDGVGSTGDAGNDADCWKQMLFDNLPPGSTADISEDAANSSFTITLAWTDRDGTEHPVTFTFQP
jgi:type IV pilus assembly protein PilV